MTQQPDSYERYQRQIVLKGFGTAAQEKLGQAKVLVIGAGGLGCPALQYLAAAGVGTIGIVDDDSISLSNLHRQVLYHTSDIGLPKVSCAANHLAGINPLVQLLTWQERLDSKNALAILEPFDIVIDGTDNFASRYLINDACVLLNKPLVYGAVAQFEGQVAIFNAHPATGARSVHYRDLFPVPPKDGEVLNCAIGGVLGVLPGIIGTMQATEAIKLITGIGDPLVDRLFTYNALTASTYTIHLKPVKGSEQLLPADKAAFEAMDYAWLCNNEPTVEEIEANAVATLLQSHPVTVIDVREFGEMPFVTDLPHIKAPLSTLAQRIPTIEHDTVIVFCQSGKRSQQAAELLSATFGNTKKIISLKGGILSWLQSKPIQL